MPQQDPNPLPYGALQYYQIHFIVEGAVKEAKEYLARCEPKIKGYFGNRKVVDIVWYGGGMLADSLNTDIALKEMLKDSILEEGEITVDPLDTHIRIYGRWKHEDDFRFNPLMLDIADRIAMHINSTKEKMKTNN